MEIMAIIRDAHIGTRDVGRPVLWFDVAGEGWGALQIFDYDDPMTKEILSFVERLENLNGKPCIVEKEDGIVRFKRMVKV